MNRIKYHTIFAILAGLLIFSFPICSFATSGGIMGGSSFDSSSFDSSSFHSSSSMSSYSSLMPVKSRKSAAFDSGNDNDDGVRVDSLVESKPWQFLACCTLGFVVILGLFHLFSNWSKEENIAGSNNVIKLQIGLMGTVQALKSDLNRIAEVADSSTETGLSYILTETTLALLRYPNYWISACSSVDNIKSFEKLEKRFNQLSFEERGKVDEVTLFNVDNIKRRSTKKFTASDCSNDCIVVTILVAALGVYELPTINSNTDMKDALQKLGTIPKHKTKAVEVIWLPQNEDDSLPEKLVLQKYPLLKTINDILLL